MIQLRHLRGLKAASRQLLCCSFPPLRHLSALQAGVNIGWVPLHQMMEDLTRGPHGCCEGVELLQRPCSRRVGPFAMHRPRITRGAPDAPGRGGGSVLCLPERYRPATLPAVGKSTAASGCAVHQPHCPLHCSRPAASEVQAEQRYTHVLHSHNDFRCYDVSASVATKTDLQQRQGHVCEEEIQQH